MAKREEIDRAANVPDDTFISDHKTLKRTVMLWSTAVLATFVLVAKDGSVTLFGATIEPGHVSVARLGMAGIVLFYLAEFIISFVRAWRRHSGLDADAGRASEMLAKATTQLQNEAQTIVSLAMSWRAPPVRYPDVEAQFRRNLETALGKALQAPPHLQTLSPEQIQQATSQAFSETAPAIAKAMDEVNQGYLQQLQFSANNLAQVPLLSQRMTNLSKDFYRSVNSLKSTAKAADYVQFFGFDLGATVALAMVATLAATFPGAAKTVVDWAVTHAPSPAATSGSVPPARDAPGASRAMPAADGTTPLAQGPGALRSYLEHDHTLANRVVLVA